jgi:hypothetical protein
LEAAIFVLVEVQAHDELRLHQPGATRWPFIKQKELLMLCALVMGLDLVGACPIDHHRFKCLNCSTVGHGCHDDIMLP